MLRDQVDLTMYDVVWRTNNARTDNVTNTARRILAHSSSTFHVLEERRGVDWRHAEYVSEPEGLGVD